LDFRGHGNSGGRIMDLGWGAERDVHSAVSLGPGPARRHARECARPLGTPKVPDRSGREVQETAGSTHSRADPRHLRKIIRW
jgi:hypothetical protein